MPSPARTPDDRARGRGRDRAAEWEEHWARVSDGSIPDWPRFRLSGWVTLWVPVVISFVVQVPGALVAVRMRGLFDLGEAFGDEPARLVVRILLALLGPVALVFARRLPGPVVAVVSAAAAAYVLLTAHGAAPPYIALAFAVVGAVVRGARVWAWVSLGAAWLLAITGGLLLHATWEPALVVAVSLGLVLLLGVGEGIRTRRQRMDELRRRAADRRLTAVQAERVRIARELHDVLAHSLSQINVQAGVGLHLIDTQPEKAASALADIKEASKRALDEVRSVLGVLREGQDAAGGSSGEAPEAAPLIPEPDLSRVASLVDSVSSQGVAVSLENGIAHPDAVPKPTQLALYRIVQESLTNVVRHAEARTAAVTLAETAEGYTVSVTDDGAGTGTGTGGSAGAQPRPGRGLLGMRERAELLGGSFAAGPRPGGGFTVAATLPRPTGGSIPFSGGGTEAGGSTDPGDER